MRIVRYLDGQGQVRWGRERGGEGGEGGEGIEPMTGDLFTGLTPDPAAHPLSRNVIKLRAPLTPANIFCVGLNYRAHAAESNSPIPEHPVLFMKPGTALNHPGEPIRIPRCCNRGPEVDYECELAVVIGKTARNVSVQDALAYVLGYTIANDVSARRWQRHNGGQWVRGKGFDTFCPLGPVLVTAGSGPDEIADPGNLRLSTLLNGQVMQDSTTSDMIFTVAQIVSFLSMDTTLLPGTVILTGTPPGVGFARKPPVFMQPGDQVTCRIDGIGELTNPVVPG